MGTFFFSMKGKDLFCYSGKKCGVQKLPHLTVSPFISAQCFTAMSHFPLLPFHAKVLNEKYIKLTDCLPYLI